MEEPWKIILYRSPSGNYPVREFIDSLEMKAQSKVEDTIKLLRVFDIHLGLPHAKKLTGTEFWELRIIGSNSARILYIAMIDKAFVLLHGFKKKQDKTPPNEIKIAEKRLAELRLRMKLGS